MEKERLFEGLVLGLKGSNVAKSLERVKAELKELEKMLQRGLR